MVSANRTSMMRLEHEVRPAQGFYVSVTQVTLNREVRILDLAQVPEEINPFITETLRWDVEIQSLLEAFAEEMSRPLERDDDPAHYRPCQRLADYIRDARYDGIRYPSALQPEGTNVIFFDPAVADVGACGRCTRARADMDCIHASM